MTILKQKVKQFFKITLFALIAFFVFASFYIGLGEVLNRLIPYSWGTYDDIGSYQSLSSSIAMLGATAIVYLSYVGYHYIMGQVKPPEKENEDL